MKLRNWIAMGMIAGALATTASAEERFRRDDDRYIRHEFRERRESDLRRIERERHERFERWEREQRERREFREWHERY